MPHLEIHIGKTSSESTIKADGQDIAQFIQGVTVQCEVNKPTVVTLKASPFAAAPFDISGPFMEVPRCDKCQHWRTHGTSTRVCEKAGGVATKPDFGCVLFRPTLTGEPHEPT